MTRNSNLYFELSATGDFLIANQEDYITLTPLTSKFLIQVLTDNDGVDESDGAVTITLLPGEAGFIAPSPDNTASIPIIDNDTPSAPNGQELTFDSGNRLPRLSLAIDTKLHPNGFATDASDFSFKIIADQYLTSAIPAVNLTQTVPNAPSLNLFRVFSSVPLPVDFTSELPANVNSSIITRDSSEDELILTLQPGEGYLVGTPNTVSISKTGLQTGLSIFADTEFVSESEQVSFTIVSEIPVSYSFPAYINLDQGTSDFIDGAL